jgi:voltage-gated potassium channel Kch
LDFFEPTAKQWEQDLKDLRVRLVGAGLFLVSVTIVGTVGFRLIDPAAGWVRAFFMTAITLTTVGYGREVALESSAALIFTAVLILVGMGGALYFVSTATAFVLEGQLGHVFRRRRIERDLATIHDHLIVCGSDSTAVYTACELLAVNRRVIFVYNSRIRTNPYEREALRGLAISIEHLGGELQLLTDVTQAGPLWGYRHRCRCGARFERKASDTCAIRGATREQDQCRRECPHTVSSAS